MNEYFATMKKAFPKWIERTYTIKCSVDDYLNLRKQMEQQKESTDDQIILSIKFYMPAGKTVITDKVRDIKVDKTEPDLKKAILTDPEYRAYCKYYSFKNIRTNKCFTGFVIWKKLGMNLKVK